MSELSGNIVPEQIRHVHLVAICGTGMGALAGMLAEMGYEVTGSDENVYPPMSTFLAGKGIPVFEGFRAENLSKRPDLVVIGNAVRKENPEAVAVFGQGIPYCSMPQAVNRLAAGGKKRLVIAGTHGKTTTSAMLAWALFRLGLDPGFMIGGIVNGFQSNYRIGNGPYMVIEGDEYDTAFFDKGPKFFHYTPYRAVITGVEYDHADIYPDMEHIENVFLSFIRGIPEDAELYFCQDAGTLRRLSDSAGCRTFSYGRHPDAYWRAASWHPTAEGVSFSVCQGDTTWASGHMPVRGGHNVENLCAVCGILHSLGISAEDAMAALSDYPGVKRRQEVRGVVDGITVIDDFAHHPTAVLETIAAIKPHCDSRLIAVFEPRTNTSMRSVFQDAYPPAFASADLVCIRTPSRLDKIPAEERMSAGRLAEDIAGAGVPAFQFDDTDRILEFLVREARQGDTVLIMSNGGFDGIHERLLDALAARE